VLIELAQSPIKSPIAAGLNHALAVAWRKEGQSRMATNPNNLARSEEMLGNDEFATHRLAVGAAGMTLFRQIEIPTDLPVAPAF
jgi:hypothetical protein